MTGKTINMCEASYQSLFCSIFYYIAPEKNNDMHVFGGNIGHLSRFPFFSFRKISDSAARRKYEDLLFLPNE